MKVKVTIDVPEYCFFCPMFNEVDSSEPDFCRLEMRAIDYNEIGLHGSRPCWCPLDNGEKVEIIGERNEG